MIELKEDNITSLIEMPNIAENLSDEELEKMGQEVVGSYTRDLNSRSDWEEQNRDWLKLAAQIKEDKNFPWQNAANIKYPLLTIAATQFHARSHQALLRSSTPVLAKPIGKDPDGSKKARATRLSEFMSYQVLHHADDWMEDMDRLLLILPVMGTCFKKTYYSPSLGINKSELVLPQHLVINFNAKDFARARKTHILPKDGNEIEELKRAGLYLDVDLGTPSTEKSIEQLIADESTKLSGEEDEDTSTYELLEQHYVWDLDGDGYKEPYIVTVDRRSSKVLRISAKFDENSVHYASDGRIERIEPVEYFTRYLFMPDLESKIYGMGFGSILGPMNRATNTLLNLLVDAGTLSNLQSGFLTRGVRTAKGGAMRFKPGEWKNVMATDDLRKHVFPLPTREPSSVLFSLLGLLIESGKETGTIGDAMMGKNPGQNQPYSTTVSVLEQGIQVFVGIYKRIYRSLSSEFRKLYRLNGIYLDDSIYQTVLDNDSAVMASDFEVESFDVIPSADPDLTSSLQKMMKAEALVQKMMAGLPLDKEAVTRAILEAEGHENIEELMTMKPPPPDPKIQLEQEKFEHQKKLDEADEQRKDVAIRGEALKDMADAFGKVASALTAVDSSEAAYLKEEYAKLTKMNDNMLAQEGLQIQKEGQQLQAKGQREQGVMNLMQEAMKGGAQQSAESNTDTASPQAGPNPAGLPFGGAVGPTG
jgi:chaperonin GroES